MTQLHPTEDGLRNSRLCLSFCSRQISQKGGREIIYLLGKNRFLTLTSLSIAKQSTTWVHVYCKYSEFFFNALSMFLCLNMCTCVQCTYMSLCTMYIYFSVYNLHICLCVHVCIYISVYRCFSKAMLTPEHRPLFCYGRTDITDRDAAHGLVLSLVRGVEKNITQNGNHFLKLCSSAIMEKARNIRF